MRKYIIAAAAATMIAPAAHAATMSQTESIGLQETDWNETLSFDQFDPSLGTLTSVVFELFGDVQGSARAENLGGSSIIANLNLEAEIEATVGGFSGVVGFVLPAAGQDVELSAYDGESDFGGTSGVVLDDLTGSDTDSRTFTSALAPFIGTGSVSVDVVADASSSAGGGGNIISQFLTNASAEGTITYNYDEPVSAVPLPAAAWMLLASLGSLLAFRRYKTS